MHYGTATRPLLPRVSEFVDGLRAEPSLRDSALRHNASKREHGIAVQTHPDHSFGPLSGHFNAWPSARRTFPPWEFTAKSWRSRCASEFSYFSTFSGATARTSPRRSGRSRKTTNFPIFRLRPDSEKLFLLKRWSLQNRSVQVGKKAPEEAVPALSWGRA